MSCTLFYFDGKMERTFKCPMCHYSTFVKSCLETHYVRTHKYDPNFLVTCTHDTCGATFKRWKSYKIHVRRKHKTNVENEVEPPPLPENDAAYIQQFFEQVPENEMGMFLSLS